MMNAETMEVVLISSLDHYTYCPRRCALIFMETVFEDNIYTLRGREVHDQVDKAGFEMEEGQRIERAMPLWSERLGLQGKADVVLFQHDGTPYPIEYKSGKKGVKCNDDVQLCAQAMCLEEMLCIEVPRGAIYYVSSRRRREVVFTPELRRLTEETVVATRTLLEEGRLPPPVNDERCPNCSLVHLCMPEVTQRLQLEPEPISPFEPVE